jgi:RNA polymerase sigma-70 factor (ECF subfamily)
MAPNKDSALTPREVIDDVSLVERLRQGDDTAFLFLVNQHQNALVREAVFYLSDKAIAEEVVQETWIAMLRGLDQFEGRSSLKTWIFSILANRAKTRAQREKRSVPLSEFSGEDDLFGDATVEPERFANPRYSGHWVKFPDNWDNIPEDQLLSQETIDVVQKAIQNLPMRQQQVIALRDVDGYSAEEVCNILTISETNQRVLLHRARASVRRMLEAYFE